MTATANQVSKPGWYQVLLRKTKYPRATNDVTKTLTNALPFSASISNIAENTRSATCNSTFKYEENSNGPEMTLAVSRISKSAEYAIQSTPITIPNFRTIARFRYLRKHEPQA